MSTDDFWDGKKFDDSLGMCSEVDRRTKPFGKLRLGGHVPLGITVNDNIPNVIAVQDSSRAIALKHLGKCQRALQKRPRMDEENS